MPKLVLDRPHFPFTFTSESGRGISVEKLDDGLVIQNADDPLKLVEWQLSYKRKCVQGMKEGEQIRENVSF